jgi:alpha/beta hydrolase fold
MSSSSAPLSTPEGPGSVSGAPNLPEGFTDTFTSRYVDTGDLRQHAIIGGEGPPLLLVHGWPQTWYQYRLVMPALARDFEVIAVDQRGIGLSDKPHDGYDIGTLAADMVSLALRVSEKNFTRKVPQQTRSPTPLTGSGRPWVRAVAKVLCGSYRGCAPAGIRRYDRRNGSFRQIRFSETERPRQSPRLSAPRAKSIRLSLLHPTLLTTSALPPTQ